ncbi:MAG: phosphoglucosamine mutase [Bacteroidota bacterium]
MTLIRSISGIRGTIGGKAGEGLTPADVVRYVSGYCSWLKEKTKKNKLLVIVGRDARISGAVVNSLVCSTFNSCGADVIDIGLATTPTVEVAIPFYNADGGIIITASHNPAQWNALKLLNGLGEFVSAKDGERILHFAETAETEYCQVEELGSYTQNNEFLKEHIRQVLALSLVNVEKIKAANFSVVVDPVNSVGAIAVPAMLEALGVKNVICINEEANGQFAHNPEPLPEHLVDLSKKVIETKSHLGIAVDPDVDRLALVCEDGKMFGEEYTLVAVADYVLNHKKGNTVSNLSSSLALRDVTESKGCSYFASAVGEVNVVEMMKEKNAVIGGEGNGGIIYPELHYGRDALVGIALFLSHLADQKISCSALRKNYPDYFMSKNKIALKPGMDVQNIFAKMKELYSKQPVSTIDGLKISLDKEWVHLRTSNTEAIIRVYAESTSAENADKLAQRVMSEINSLA